MTTTKTTVREFDDTGRMVKETVTEVDDAQVAALRNYCACGRADYVQCPVHGFTVTSTITKADPKLFTVNAAAARGMGQVA